MKNFFLKHWLKISGVTVGALAGYLYYYYVGCVSGTCPITSNPYRMLIYGALLGYLLFDMFSPKNRSKKAIESIDNKENKIK
ncbi:MAG: hypothetical protein A2W86_08820 [Bacteroidetes bacterium GWD2_45_23]|nr:MAG: hypothetical protein A2W87_09595 [Bacteroidetes bacterium GWC2_46_850]OFX76847.1 MAG: hypothetical protein A2071_02845 [Bacteroidetes bacterium GWC1_47_7]OFX87103.1 MAG: hypothetical protein A2W86_08820 [Bacteroidetes bacterium GWD2_45_23]HAR38365.1 hypothetical protein [Porphyromonadaceae bacterium]HBB01812.1 hypothetical protein [Porphyromonadaceae bacterium]